MIVDANILLYAADSESRHFSASEAWLEKALNGSTRVGLPWESLTAFLRIVTNQRLGREPLSSARARDQVANWIKAPAAWIPTPTPDHAAVLSDLIEKHDVRGNLVPDAHLAALAFCHGVPVCSADTDFARFSEIRWINPVAQP